MVFFLRYNPFKAQIIPHKNKKNTCFLKGSNKKNLTPPNQTSPKHSQMILTTKSKIMSYQELDFITLNYFFKKIIVHLYHNTIFFIIV
jgi:hypothetical protein